MNEALTSLLLADPPLAALVADRVHWLRLPRRVSGFPYLNLQVISDPGDYHTLGDSGWHSTRVQADAWGESYSDAKAVERALRARLSGWRGVWGGIFFQGVFVVESRDLSDATAGEERQLFRIQTDLSIKWALEA